MDKTGMQKSPSAEMQICYWWDDEASNEIYFTQVPYIGITILRDTPPSDAYTY